MTVRGLTIAIVLGTATVVIGGLARADAKGERLLKQIREAERSAKTLSATYTIDKLYGGEKSQEHGTVSMKKPRMMRLQIADAYKTLLVSDGKRFKLMGNGEVVNEGDTTLQNLDISSGALILFYGAGTSADMVLSAAELVQYAGTRVIDGIKCEVLNVTIGKPVPGNIRVYANASHIIIRYQQMIGRPVQIGSTCTFKNSKSE